MIIFLVELEQNLDKLFNEYIIIYYSKILRFCLNNRWAVSAAVFATILIVTGLFQGSHVRAQFFPELEPPYARIQATVPAGMSAEVADKIRDNLIDKALAFGKSWED